MFILFLDIETFSICQLGPLVPLSEAPPFTLPFVTTFNSGGYWCGRQVIPLIKKQVYPIKFSNFVMWVSVSRFHSYLFPHLIITTSAFLDKNRPDT